MRLVLIGQKDTKRTDYFLKAAGEQGESPDIICWDEINKTFDFTQLRGASVKIDPPSYQTTELSTMQKHLITYQATLQKLASADCHFLNSPDAVCRMLDKKDTKLLLQKEGVPVTRMFSEQVKYTDELLELLVKKRCYSVFIKPRFFSGAAGVAALHLHPVRRNMVLYTSCHMENNTLINTKKLRRLEDSSKICTLLNALLSLDCVIERWHPKAAYNKKTYDLRVVWQFGHIAYIVVRQSDSPITNLHLNNQAMEFASLGLPEDIMISIHKVCESAISQFDGLNMAGIDILLERETLKPVIIEINGQGDLIYQDIYAENRIYKEQVMYLCR